MKTGIVAAVALLFCGSVRAQEITLEEVRVESVSPFELPLEKTVQALIERLQAQSDARRDLELRAFHQNPLSTLLDLSAYSPVSLGSSERPVDTFFWQNYMRPELNPRETASIFGSPPAREKSGQR